MTGAKNTKAASATLQGALLDMYTLVHKPGRFDIFYGTLGNALSADLHTLVTGCNSVSDNQVKQTKRKRKRTYADKRKINYHVCKSE